MIERGAGVKSEFADLSFSRQGGVIIDNRGEMFQTADVIARVKRSDPAIKLADLNNARTSSLWIGFHDPQIADRSHLSRYAQHSNRFTAD